MTAQSVALNPVVDEAVFTNARLVLSQETILGTVQISDGTITAIDQGVSRLAGAVDLAGDYLCPGLVELHTDNLERHLKPRPGVAWPLQPAIVAHDAELAATGISTVYDALRVGSILRDGRTDYSRYARDTATAILDLRKSGALRISHFIHLRAEICSETLVEELDEFGSEDRVGIVSLMDHTPHQRQFADPAQMRTYLSGKYAMSAAEIDAHFETLLSVKEEFGALHEEMALLRGKALGACLASHDDTTEAHVRDSEQAGVRLAEFPTTLEAARACHDRGIAVVMGAPNLLRGKSHSGNVSAQTLLDDGLLDILSSDYVPASLLAAAVKIGLETGDMAKGLAKVTTAPAAAVGLKDRGKIEQGLRADLCQFRLEGDVPIPISLQIRGRRVA